MQAAKGFQPDITPEFHFDIFPPGTEHPDYALEILIATKDGQDVAGIVVGAAGPTATYLFVRMLIALGVGVVLLTLSQRVFAVMQRDFAQEL